MQIQSPKWSPHVQLLHTPSHLNIHEKKIPMKTLTPNYYVKADLSSGWHAAALFGLLTFDLKVRWGYGVSLTLTWGHSLVLNVELLHEGD